MPAHLAFPIRVTTRGLATVEQDSDADIAQSVRLLLTTRPGERRSVPEYGLPDPVFAGATDDEIYDVVAEWEERAELDQLTIQNTQVSDNPTLVVGYGEGTYGGGIYG